MPKRQGLTLVELLAVIAVMAVLLSVAVPVIRPALKDRKLRESARLINAYVAGVQARAAELGRPVGIVLTRGTTNARDAYQCTEIFTAEVPRPYAGDLVDSKARVTRAGTVWTVSFPGNVFFDTLIKAPVSDAQGNVVAPGQLFALKLDYKEPLYQCRSLGKGQAVFDNNSLDLSGPPRQLVNADGSYKRSVPFQIMRSPTRSTATPLQLPNGIGIDLSVSGMGFRGTEFNPTSKLGAGNITIMFNPNGSIERIYVGGQPLPQTTRIYLMIGRLSQINPTNPFQQGNNSNEMANLRDPANYWMSINPKTGLIRTSINRPDLIKNADNSGIKLRRTRTDAIDGITVGGR